MQVLGGKPVVSPDNDQQRGSKVDYCSSACFTKYGKGDSQMIKRETMKSPVDGSTGHVAKALHCIQVCGWDAHDVRQPGRRCVGGTENAASVA